VGTLVCSVEVDKTGGITVTVTDADGKIEQTLVMNGVKIELTVKGESATSTLTQTAEKVAIKCQQFEVEAAETLTLKSTKASSWTSSDGLSVKSTKSLSLSSDDQINATAQKTIEVKGQMGVALSSLQKIALSSQGQLTFEGATIEAKSQGMLKLESSGLATLKGSITNVQGTLVNLG